MLSFNDSLFAVICYLTTAVVVTWKQPACRKVIDLQKQAFLIFALLLKCVRTFKNYTNSALYFL